MNAPDGAPAALVESFTRDVDPTTGFLPRRTPARTLPARWQLWSTAVDEMPGRYHSAGPGVRGWLDELFAEPVPDANDAVAALAEPEGDRLLTILSVLAHSYRWGSAPPASESYSITRLPLPPGIAEPWSALCRLRGHPRVGNLYSMVLSNWNLDGVAGGEIYDVDALDDDAIQPAILWLAPPKSEGLRAFLRAPIETEARGARVVRTAVDIVDAVAREDAHQTTDLFERFHGELASMGKGFREHIQKNHFSSDDFLRLIQPTTLWGLDDGDGPLEGASGPQIGVLQVIDALLGISRASPMGTAVLHSRRYLPERHRRFLGVFETAAPIVRTFVSAAGDRAMTSLFNACLASMKAWRLVHQKRGAMYLKADTPGLVGSYTSTGGVVALEDERIHRFESVMQERVAETTGALLPQAIEDPLPERPFRYLTDEDLAELRAAAWIHVYAPGAVVMAAGVRRTGLFLLREGDAEVRARDGSPLGTLVPGMIFGEVSYLENSETSTAVVATTACRVEIIPREHIYSMCETRDGFAARFHLSMARIVAGRLRETSERLAAAEAELRALKVT